MLDETCFQTISTNKRRNLLKFYAVYFYFVQERKKYKSRVRFKTRKYDGAAVVVSVIIPDICTSDYANVVV